MRRYRVHTPAGMELEVQANDEAEVYRLGFMLAPEPAPETKKKTAANKAAAPAENKGE